MPNTGFMQIFSQYKDKILLLTISLALSLIVGVALLEIYYSRVYGYDWGTQFDKQLGWVPIANNSNIQEGIRYTINSSGFRSGEVDDSKKHILLVGDSIAYGAFVQNNETMGHFLQNIYDEYQVVNLGVSGYGLGQYYLRLKKHIGTLDPAMVLVVIGTGEDRWDTSVNVSHAAKPYFILKDKTKATDHSKVDPDNLLLIDDHVRRFSCYNFFLSSKTLRFSGLHRFQDYFCPRITTNRVEMRYVIPALLLKIQQLVDENGSKLTFVLSPDRFAFTDLKKKNKLFEQATQGLPPDLVPNYIFYNPEILMWKQFMQKMGFDYIDLFPKFLEQGLTANDLFISWRYDNYHYSAEGNKRVSDVIFNHLKKKI